MDTLDLSKFAHIVQPSQLEDKEEVAKRSKNLQVIKDLMANFVAACDVYVTDLASFDSKARILAQREYNIQEQEYATDEKEKEVYSREEKIEQEKVYIAKANTDLKEREAKMLTNKDYLDEITIAKEEYETRKSEAIRQEKLLDEKKKDIELLNKKQLELDEKESLLARSSVVDVERKRLLDIREERIKAQMTRLHMDLQE